MLILVYTRSITTKHIRAEDIASPIITAFPQDSGSTKFGKTPGGGCAAGNCASSTPESVERLMSLEEIFQIEYESKDARGDAFLSKVMIAPSVIAGICTVEKTIRCIISFIMLICVALYCLSVKPKYGNATIGEEKSRHLPERALYETINPLGWRGVAEKCMVKKVK